MLLQVRGKNLMSSEYNEFNIKHKTVQNQLPVALRFLRRNLQSERMNLSSVHSVSLYLAYIICKLCGSFWNSLVFLSG